MLDWMNAWMNDEKYMQLTEWMNEGMKNLGKIEVSGSSGLLHRLAWVNSHSVLHLCDLSHVASLN